MKGVNVHISIALRRGLRYKYVITFMDFINDVYSLSKDSSSFLGWSDSCWAAPPATEEMQLKQVLCAQVPEAVSFEFRLLRIPHFLLLEMPLIRVITQGQSKILTWPQSVYFFIMQLLRIFKKAYFDLNSPVLLNFFCQNRLWHWLFPLSFLDSNCMLLLH